jgi:hypothetical protein
VVALLCCVLTVAASAFAECAWVLWKYQGMAYSGPAPLEAIDAFETRGACVEAVNKFEAKYKEAHYQRIDRMNETTLFVASGPLGQNREEVHVTCRPDTVDPRGPKGK